MRTFFYSFLLLIFFFACTMFYGVAFAVQSDFRVSQQVVSNDFTPPSIPANLLATVLTHSSIRLDWDPATDDQLLSGYVLYRDGMPIASTTLTTFEDSGLSASTTYEYAIRSYDFASNYSILSPTTTATTFDLPPPVVPTPTPTPSSTGRTQTSFFRRLFGLGQTELSLRVSTNGTEAVVEWDTTRQSDSKLSWGLTSDTELGTIYTNRLVTTHRALISDLTPRARYYVRVESRAEDGTLFSSMASFIASDSSDLASAIFTNIARISLVKNLSETLITWTNPDNLPREVRVVRSDKFYPEGPNDGKIIYEGNSTFASDVVPKNGETYYYTVFIKDENGKFSTGATERFVVGGSGSGGVIYPSEVMSDLAEKELEVYQDGTAVKSERGVFKLETDATVEVRLATTTRQKDYRVIVMTLYDRLAKPISYIFNYDPILDRYVTFIPVNAFEASFQSFTVIHYGHDNRPMKLVGGYFKVAEELQKKEAISKLAGAIADHIDYVFGLLVIFLLFMIFAKLNRVVPPQIPRS